MNGFLVFDRVSKRFGPVQAVDGCSLEIARGEIFSFLGPSGCGKTTLLRIVAGLERPDAGRIYLDGHDITDLPPNRRKVNTIFQSYALFPHLTVRENIAFGPRVAGRPAAEIRAETDRMLALTQLEDVADKRPDQLSGGQKQRVAIARALINRPDVLLLDEPLAALDLKLRQRMLIELDAIHDEVGITFLYVTHDQGEAMSLSDRIAVMRAGRIEQIGRPMEIYEAPRTRFVASFIGDTNFFTGRVETQISDDYCRIAVAGLGPLICYNDKRIAAGEQVCLSVRPEKCRIGREPPQPDDRLNVVRGTVEDVVYLGDHTRYWVRVADHRIVVQLQHHRFLLDERPITWKEPVWLSWHADDGFMIEEEPPSVSAPAEDAAASAAERGGR